MYLVQWQAQNKDKLIMTKYDDPKHSDIDQSRRFGRAFRRPLDVSIDGGTRYSAIYS